MRENEIVQINCFDLSGKFVEIEKQDSTEKGWVLTDKLQLGSLDMEEIVKKKTLPLRLQKLFRERRISQLKDKAKKLEKEEIFQTATRDTVEMLVDQDYTIKSGESRHIGVHPVVPCSDFMMVTPNDLFLQHESLEILDGSYYKSKGGYVIASNRSNKDYIFAANTKIGIGEIIKRYELPFDLYEDDSEISISSMSLEKMSPEDLKSLEEKNMKEFMETVSKEDKLIQPLLIKYKEMFLAPNPMDWHTLNFEDLNLMERDNIPSSLPISHRRPRTTEDEEAIRLYVEAGLLSGYLKEVVSEYSSPLLVVVRPGCTKRRVCVDARLVNTKLLKPVNYPLPTTWDVVKRIGHNTIYTALDARQAFNQIRLSERSQKLVAFSTYINGIRNTYTSVGMPFGIVSGPAYYQKMIDGVTRKFKRPSSDMESYIDDMTLGSRAGYGHTDIENHVFDLDIVLNRLQQVGFKLQLPKCKFLQRSVEICGYELSGGKYRPSAKHRKLLENLKPFSVLDSTKNAILRFLGTIGYHRRFGGSQYAKSEKEIRMLVEAYQNKSIPAKEVDKKIQVLSSALIRIIIDTCLVLPSPSDKLVLNTDASGVSWGATLSIPGKGVVSHHGGTFPQRIIDKYSTFSKEVLGLLYGCESNIDFIIDATETIIKSDNMATVVSSTAYKVHTKAHDIVNIMKIQQFLSLCKGDISIKHCSGSSNLCADYLSRLVYDLDDHPTHSMSCMSTGESFIYDPETHNGSAVTQISALSVELNSDKIDKNEYMVLKTEHEAHHLSLGQTFLLLKERDRQGKKKLLKRVIRECNTCNRKLVKIAPYNKISLKPTPFRPFQDISVDFAFPEVESSANHTCLLTIRCELTRYFAVYPMKSRQITEVIINLDSFFRGMGTTPDIISLDNEFNLPSTRVWAKTSQFKVHFRCAENSRSIGVERTHETLWQRWNKVMFEKNPKSWHVHLNKIIDPINKVPNKVTGVSPYKCIFGVSPLKINGTEIEENTKADKARNLLFKAIRRKTIDSKESYSKNHDWPILQEGQEVVIKYSGGKKGKEKPGVVLAFSGKENPRVDVFFDQNKKCKEMGIHKGMIYLRQEVLPPLFEAALLESPEMPHFSVETKADEELTKVKPLIMGRKSSRESKKPQRLNYEK